MDARAHADTLSILKGDRQLAADAALSLRRRPARSLYIHVPFCFHKCHYCDFYSFVDTQDRQALFVEALVRELETLARHADSSPGLETIFIGGGTPSLLAPTLWRTLLGALGDLFNLVPIGAGPGEFTVECNPETVTRGLMDALAAGGVNRISVGAQSFNTAHLKTLERWHEPASVQRALRFAAEAGVNRRSVDLIYAIPGQSLDDVRADLDAALALHPGVEHISAYCLTYEPNTPLFVRAGRGEITPIGEDAAADMQTLVFETLRDAGFDRYEVSNFARRSGLRDPSRMTSFRSEAGETPVSFVLQDTVTGETPVPPVLQTQDCRSKHNLVYWRTGAWLAAGPAAAGHLLTTDPATGLPAGVRWKNLPRLTEWMNAVNESGRSPIVDFEPPDPRRTLIERIMMGVRLAEGLDAALIHSHADALGVVGALDAAVKSQIEAGLLEATRDRWRLTERGFLFADAVAAELMNSIKA